MNKLIQQITEVRKKLRKKLEREPTIQEISKEVDMLEEEVLKALDEYNLRFSFSPATLQFFAIYEKEKPILVLPHLLNTRFMTDEEMSKLPLRIALSGNIIIPKELIPWSEITESADHIFLALQSRRSWGIKLDEKTNLLKVDSVRKLVESMEESLNNYTWRKDYLSGKFSSKGSERVAKRVISQPEDMGSGIKPGENWSP